MSKRIKGNTTKESASKKKLVNEIQTRYSNADRKLPLEGKLSAWDKQFKVANKGKNKRQSELVFRMSNDFDKTEW